MLEKILAILGGTIKDRAGDGIQETEFPGRMFWWKPFHYIQYANVQYLHNKDR